MRIKISDETFQKVLDIVNSLTFLQVGGEMSNDEMDKVADAWDALDKSVLLACLWELKQFRNGER
jgi:hypothetical protein